MAIEPGPIWLVINPASGSNDTASVDRLRSLLAAAGHSIVRETCFPEDPLPSASELATRSVGRVAIFTGDGSINALVDHLHGWGGEVLVLPGGTMNLLSKRLHGDEDAGTIIDRLGAADTRACRPSVIETAHGTGLSGVLVGPGAVWSDVREAMRDGDVPGILQGAAHAVSETAVGPRARCADPPLGRREGYPLLLLSPDDDGFRVAGYFADDLADYVSQAASIAARDFRNGPHEDLGSCQNLAITNVEGASLHLLVDGEPREGSSTENFTLAQCGVKLIATRA